MVCVYKLCFSANKSSSNKTPPPKKKKQQSCFIMNFKWCTIKKLVAIEMFEKNTNYIYIKWLKYFNDIFTNRFHGAIWKDRGFTSEDETRYVLICCICSSIEILWTVCVHSRCLSNGIRQYWLILWHKCVEISGCKTVAMCNQSEQFNIVHEPPALLWIYNFMN